MLVKYKGKAKAILSDYNGKRYSFRASSRIQDIPIEVYNHIILSRHVHAGDVVPYTEGYINRIAELEAEVINLKAQLEKKSKKSKKVSKDEKEL